jgi:hypothetical protein
VTTWHPLSAKVGITSPTSGGRSVGIVRSGTQTMEFLLSYIIEVDLPEVEVDWLLLLLHNREVPRSYLRQQTLQSACFVFTFLRLHIFVAVVSSAWVVL